MGGLVLLCFVLPCCEIAALLQERHDIHAVLVCLGEHGLGGGEEDVVLGVEIGRAHV